MEAQQLQRLNTLAEKAKTDTATPNELKELKQLLDAWNLSTRVNLLSSAYHPHKER